MQKLVLVLTGDNGTTLKVSKGLRKYAYSAGTDMVGVRKEFLPRGSGLRQRMS